MDSQIRLNNKKLGLKEQINFKVVQWGGLFLLIKRSGKDGQY